VFLEGWRCSDGADTKNRCLEQAREEPSQSSAQKNQTVWVPVSSTARLGPAEAVGCRGNRLSAGARSTA
jgi:hypothetical protein